MDERTMISFFLFLTVHTNGVKVCLREGWGGGGMQQTDNRIVRHKTFIYQTYQNDLNHHRTVSLSNGNH